VRLGDQRTRAFYLGLVAVSIAMVLVVALQHPFALIALLALGLLWKPVQLLRSGATGRALVQVLAGTGVYEIAYAVLLAVGIALSS
jgi:1,4-dihydroxy-2-naphthoate octaprenyltransferase